MGRGYPRGRFEGARKGFVMAKVKASAPRSSCLQLFLQGRGSKGRPKGTGKERILSFKAVGWKLRDMILRVAS